MGDTLEVRTENDLQYKFYPVSCGSVQFKVRAPKDAHIALTSGPEATYPMIEVIIGGWNNTKCAIRRDEKRTEKFEKIVETGHTLNAEEFRDFFVRWDGGTIAAGRGNETLIEWVDKDPFPIAFIGVCTGWGATGIWKMQDGAEFYTPDRLQYKFGPVATGYLEVDFRGSHDAHICLTNSLKPAATPKDPIYEIMLGAWSNSHSAILYNRQKLAKIAVPVEENERLNPNEYKKFLIDFHCGRITVRDREDGHTVMEWTDTAPAFPIRYFGVRTAHGARGAWRIHRYFKQVPKAQDYIPVEPQYPVPPPRLVAIKPGEWVHAADGKLARGAMGGGYASTGEPMYVARASHGGELVPGYVLLSQKRAFVPWNGKEHPHTKYEVLVGGSNTWVKAHGDKIPRNAFPAGETNDKESLYIGRVKHEDSVIIGKVHQSHGKCYVGVKGQEVGFDEYEILIY